MTCMSDHGDWETDPHFETDRRSINAEVAWAPPSGMDDDFRVLARRMGQRREVERIQGACKGAAVVSAADAELPAASSYAPPPLGAMPVTPFSLEDGVVLETLGVSSRSQYVLGSHPSSTEAEAVAGVEAAVQPPSDDSLGMLVVDPNLQLLNDPLMSPFLSPFSPPSGASGASSSGVAIVPWSPPSGVAIVPWSAPPSDVGVVPWSAPPSGVGVVPWSPPSGVGDDFRVLARKTSQRWEAAAAEGAALFGVPVVGVPVDTTEEAAAATEGAATAEDAAAAATGDAKVADFAADRIEQSATWLLAAIAVLVLTASVLMGLQAAPVEQPLAPAAPPLWKKALVATSHMSAPQIALGLSDLLLTGAIFLPGALPAVQSTLTAALPAIASIGPAVQGAAAVAWAPVQAALTGALPAVQAALGRIAPAIASIGLAVQGAAAAVRAPVQGATAALATVGPAIGSLLSSSAPATAPVAVVTLAGTRRLAAVAADLSFVGGYGFFVGRRSRVALRSFLKARRARRVAAPELTKAAASASKRARVMHIKFHSKAGPKTIKILTIGTSK